MSLILKSEPEVISGTTAQDLQAGSWYIDQDGQIYVIACDDRLQERRVICLGHFNIPFIMDGTLDDFEVERVVLTGSTFELVHNVHVRGARL